jgi:hypothetical protein
MNKLSREEYIQNILKKMSFLTEKHGFSAPVIDNKNNFGSVIYKKNEIAIQGIWEICDQVFEIKVTLLDNNGAIPDAYKMNHNAEIVSGYITEFLMPKGVRDFDGRAEKTENRFDYEISRFLFLVENYAPEILSEGSAKNFKGIKLESDDRF